MTFLQSPLYARKLWFPSRANKGKTVANIGYFDDHHPSVISITPHVIAERSTPWNRDSCRIESAMGHSDNMESKTKVSLSLGILRRQAMENPLVPRSTPKLEINETRIGEKEEEQVGIEWGKCGPEEWSRTEEKFSLGPGTSLIHLSQQF